MASSIMAGILKILDFEGWYAFIPPGRVCQPGLQTFKLRENQQGHAFARAKSRDFEKIC
jgi:hypothetical protein